MAADSYPNLQGSFVSARKLFGTHALEKLREALTTLNDLAPHYAVYNLEPPMPSIEPIIGGLRTLIDATQEHYVNRTEL